MPNAHPDAHDRAQILLALLASAACRDPATDQAMREFDAAFSLPPQHPIYIIPRAVDRYEFGLVIDDETDRTRTRLRRIGYEPTHIAAYIAASEYLSGAPGRYEDPIRCSDHGQPGCLAEYDRAMDLLSDATILYHASSDNDFEGIFLTEHNQFVRQTDRLWETIVIYERNDPEIRDILSDKLTDTDFLALFGVTPN